MEQGRCLLLGKEDVCLQYDIYEEGYTIIDAIKEAGKIVLQKEEEQWDISVHSGSVVILY